MAVGRQMVAEGADVLDVGGQSTHPKSTMLSPEQEMERVLPVIRWAGEKVTGQNFLWQPVSGISTRAGLAPAAEGVAVGGGGGGAATALQGSGRRPSHLQYAPSNLAPILVILHWLPLV